MQNGNFIELSDCNGATLQTKWCVVSMATIISSTSLSIDSLIKAKVRAKNNKGWGDYSELNSAGATIETIPQTMNPPAIISTSITNNFVSMTWSIPVGVAAGGSNVVVDYFDLQWSQDASTWTTLVSSTTGTSYSSNTLSGGQSYYFRIRAHNRYGYSPSFSASSDVVYTS